MIPQRFHIPQIVGAQLSQRILGLPENETLQTPKILETKEASLIPFNLWEGLKVSSFEQKANTSLNNQLVRAAAQRGVWQQENKVEYPNILLEQESILLFLIKNLMLNPEFKIVNYIQPLNQQRVRTVLITP